MDVSPLADTYLPERLSEATSSRVPGNGAQQRVARDRDWTENSVLEVFSASRGSWYVAYVLQIHPGEYDAQMLTVRFWDEHMEAKQKSSARSDAMLAHVGTNTQGQLPPGFKSQASQSRPGSSAFLDTATGMKYSSPEIAWNVHFQRLREGPPMQAAPAQLVEDAPVPRRSPAAIAAGLAEDVSPAPKWSRPPTSRLSESVSTAVSSSPSAAPSACDQRWKQEKGAYIAMIEAQLEAAKVKPAQVDGQAKRSANQPQRGCPGFSPPAGPSSGQVRKSAPAFAAARG